MAKQAKDYVVTGSGKRVEVRVRTVGQAFGCVGQLVSRGKVIAETRTYPYGMTANAREGALAKASAL